MFRAIAGPSMFLLFWLAVVPGLPAEEPRGGEAEITKGTFRFLVMEVEAGREEFETGPGGWKAKGGFDIMGRKADYEVALERTEDGGVRWKSSITQGEKLITQEASIAGGKFSCEKMPGSGEANSIDLAGMPHPFLYENLLWSAFIEVSSVLARECARDGSSAPAVELTAVMGRQGVTFPVKLTKSTRWSVDQGPVQRPFWIFEIELATVQAKILSTLEGFPVRILVESQKVDVVLAGWEAFSPPQAEPTSILDSGAWRESLSKPEFEPAVEKGVMIPMRDGARLAADVYRPQIEGKAPTVLVRTPYDRAGEGMMRGNFFARRGYALVVQDVRGRFGSEGTFFPFRDEMDDGSDTIDWIASQSWSDGNVGMIGGSYVGIVQWYAAKSGNPHLKAIVPEVSPPDPDQNIPYEGGVFLLSTAWWAKVLDSMKEGRGIGSLDVKWMEVLGTLPLSDLDKALGIESPFVDEWLAHPPDDDAYWEDFRYQPHFGEMSVAALHVSGWYDGDQPGAVQNFPGMKSGAKSEEARRSQYLVMGPWGHAFNVARKLGEVDFGPEAIVDLDSVVLRFFDRYLKGKDNGIDREDPVYVFTMGRNKWFREQDWPLPATAWTALYLASEGKANKADAGGRLGLEPAGLAHATPDAFRYDPTDSPETLADFDDFIGASATADLSTLPDREDFLDYTSPPLAGAVEITGPVQVELYVSTSAADTDFYASLYRVTSEGKLYAVAGGIQRLRYRLGKDAPVPPGDVASVTIDCWATSVVLQKGDRFRLTIGSNAFPGYARNMNTLESPLFAKDPVVATNTVYHDPRRPSALVLPVIPREDTGKLTFDE